MSYELLMNCDGSWEEYAYDDNGKLIKTEEGHTR